MTQWTGANVREMSVTGDCSRGVVLQVRNQADVFLGKLDPSGTALSSITKLTIDEREDYPGGWAPDGSGFLISSARSGSYDVYHSGLESAVLHLIQGRPDTQERPVYANGGLTVLYVRHGDIWAVPASGGAARLLVEGAFNEVRCPVASNAPCVASSIEGSRYVFRAFEPDGSDLRELASTEHRDPFSHFDLSPDGTRAAVGWPSSLG